MLGFAKKAGKVSAGTDAAKASLIKRKASLLLLSDDIAENSKDMLINISRKVNIPWAILGNKYDLGTSVGKAYRVAITINDEKMATALLAAIGETEGKIETMGVVEWPK